MKKNIKKLFIEIPHSKDCRIREWSGIVKSQYFGNFAGNENVRNGRWHLWTRITCNDPKCKGVKSIHCSVLITA